MSYSFGNNTIPVYIYEGISAEVFFTPYVPTTVTVSNSSGLPSSYFTVDNSTGVIFKVSDVSNNLSPGTTESFKITITSGGNSYTSTNTVPIGAGRFLDLSGNSLCNQSFTFYKNEPISNIHFVAPFNLSNPPITVPTQPPGLSFFTSGRNSDLCGTPLTTLPSSNYLVIGKDSATGSKIITTTIRMTVSNERVLMNLSGSPIVNMTVGTPISNLVITSQFPPYPASSGVLRYSWPALPDGIVVTDICGNVQSNGFVNITASDLSYNLIIQGTPTSNAANTFKTNGNLSTVKFAARRVSPLPTVEAEGVNITFKFNETVLFDSNTVSNITLYNGVSVDSNVNFFRAQSYFGTGTVCNVFSPDLRSDLSLAYIGSGRANLIGTPSSPNDTNVYTITAVDTNNITANYVTPITVQPDSVSFVSPTPANTSYNFIVSRPSELSKDGYYPSNIQFVATAASGLPVTLSAPSLIGTGLSLDSNGIITGTPTTVTPLTTLSVTASAVGSPATTVKNDVSFAVLNDQFTFGNVDPSNFQFAQNRAVTPFAIPVTTISDRTIINYSATGLPAGLIISPAGVISGTPTSSDISGTITVIPTTGYVSGSNSYNYTLFRDSLFFFASPQRLDTIPGSSVSIQVSAISSTGITASNYQQTLSPIYGITMDSITGLVSGTLTDSIPPNQVLPPSISFTYSASAGGLDASGSAYLNTSNAIAPREIMAYHTGTNTSNIQFIPLISDDYGNNWSDMGLGSKGYGVMISDIRLREISYTNKKYIGVASLYVPYVDGFFVYTNPNAIVSTDGKTFSNFQIGNSNVNLGSITNNASTWWTAGSDSGLPAVYTSTDNGVTWNLLNSSLGYPSGFGPRNLGSTGYDLEPYLRGGLTVRQRNGVPVVGGASLGGVGPSALRMQRFGLGSNQFNWVALSNGFEMETSEFSLDSNNLSNRLVMTGSSVYQSGKSSNVFIGDADTIRWTAAVVGNPWFNATGTMNVIAYDVKFRSNQWLAVGLNSSLSDPYVFTPSIKFSNNASNWADVDLGQPIYTDGRYTSPPAFPIGPIVTDTSNWNVYAKIDVGGGKFEWRLFTHPLTTSLASNWTMVTPTGPTMDVFTDVNSSITVVTPPSFTEMGVMSSIFEYPSLPNTGPPFTSPINRSFQFYQYIAIDPIVVTAESSFPPISYFLQGKLPDGLNYSPVTGQITGIPSRVEQTRVTIYATDTNGYTSITLTFNIIVPRIVRRQDGAGAYTSLLRQYTDVLAAQNSRDNVALPSQEYGIGEFMSPSPPDAITQTIDPRCKKSEC